MDEDIFILKFERYDRATGKTVTVSEEVLAPGAYDLFLQLADEFGIQLPSHIQAKRLANLRELVD